MVTSLLALVAVSRFGLGSSLPQTPPAANPAQISPAPGQAQIVQVPLTMTNVQTFIRAERMLRTPIIDGKIDPDEWDRLFENRMTAPGTPTGIVEPRLSLAPGPVPGTSPAIPTPANPATPAPGIPSPATPVVPQTTPVKTAPGPTPSTPGPLSGTPLRRTPNPDPNAKPPAPAVVVPPPAPVVVQAPPAPAPVPVAPAPVGVQAAYLNWEPGKVFLAAVVPAGQDLLISIDGKADGFLVGRDNLELRVSPGSVNLLKARILDATNPAGPIWSDAPGFVTASKVASTTSNGLTTIEIALVDPGYGIVPGHLGDTFAVRFDAVPLGTPPSEPFMPRVTSQVKLVDAYSEGLPTGFKLNVPAKGRGAFPSDTTTVHWMFSAPAGSVIKRVGIRAEGRLNEFVNELSVPSPEFDGKGNASVDYETKVVRTAPVGYGVLKGTIIGQGWGPATAEVSFRVPPPLDLDIPAKLVKYADTVQKVKAVVAIRSNSDRRIEGHLQILPPAGWAVTSGSDRNFYIYDRKGTVLNGFELQIPAGVKGSFPITLRVAAIGTLTDQTFWVTVL